MFGTEVLFVEPIFKLNWKSRTDPCNLLWTKRQFPRILICLRSVPLLIRLRLSFSKAFSVLRSSMVISGFIDTKEFKELLLARTWEASMTLRNLTRTGRGRVLVCLNCPSLWRSFINAEEKVESLADSIFRILLRSWLCRHWRIM